jgi:hypothetical protein
MEGYCSTCQNSQRAVVPMEEEEEEEEQVNKQTGLHNLRIQRFVKNSEPKLLR